MLKHRSPLRITISSHLPYPDLLVPTRRGEVICGWTEANIGDAVFGRVVHRDIVLEVALRGVGGGSSGSVAEEATHFVGIESCGRNGESSVGGVSWSGV